jgi:ATP/maltotriose-dependent transcriptional regulator MalT
MLERLEAANLFLIPLDRERRWFRYHHLFADVLRSRLLPEQREPLAVLHERAAAWYEAEGMVDEAIEHALAGRQFERAGGLIERQWERMFQYGELRRLERWLGALPPDLIQTRPHLSLALAGLYLNDYRVDEAGQVLNDCRFEPRDAGEPRSGREADCCGGRAPGPATRDLQGRLLLMRGWTARMQGEKERAVALSRQALDILPADCHSFRSGALLNLGMLHEGGGDLVAAGEAFAAAALESQKAGLSVPRLRALYASGQLREAEGALQEAARLYHDALEYAGERGILHTSFAAQLSTALGRISYQRNERPAAAYLAEELERLDSEFEDFNSVYAVPCCFELWRLQMALGDADAADAILKRLADTARARNVAVVAPLLALLEVRRKAGEPPRGPAPAADRVAVESAGPPPSAASPAPSAVPTVPGREADSGGGVPAHGADGGRRLERGAAPGPAAVTATWLAEFEARTEGSALPTVPIPDLCLPDIQALEIVTWAQLRLAQSETRAPAATDAEGDEAGRVVTQLERFLEAMVEQGRHGSALEVRLLLATLHWQAGRRDQAVAVLEPALALAEREGYVRVFVEAGPALIPVLRQAAAQGIRPEIVGKLLSALGDAERGPGARPPGSGSALIEPLSDRELEVLRLVAARLRAAEIAAHLFVSEGTVRRHLHNLYGKLGVTSGTSAVARGRALGLL